MLSPNLAPGATARSESRIERLLFRPVPLWVLILLTLIGVAVTIEFGAIVLKPAPMGSVGDAAVAIAAIPHTLGTLLPGGGIDYVEGDYRRQPAGLWRNPAQPFVDPGYMLVTTYGSGRPRPVVQLVRLSDGRVMRDFAPDVDAANARSTFTSDLIILKRDRDATRNLMMHPLLMPDGGLIIHDSSPLARFDACGKLMWMVDGIFHHSVERGPDGNLWAVYRYPKAREPRVGPKFNDEAVAEISPDGRMLRLERIADILERNHMGGLWRGRPYNDDPFHLNDVQPVLASGRYWQRGDLFLSLRNLSMVMLYRPSTGKVLWWRSGPWSFEHDVSVIDDHRITIFDNHWRVAFPEGEVDGLNRVPVYDFATDQVSFPYAAATTRNAIRTHAQGRATPLPNGDLMLEETERGRVIRTSADGILRWRYIAADGAMRRLQLRWSRYLDPTTDGPAIQAAMKARCT
jgi:hypothetical protein